MTLDSIMNWAMPLLIVFFFTGLLYIKVKEPTDIFFSWIGGGLKSLLVSGKDKASETIEVGTEIVFD